MIGQGYQKLSKSFYCYTHNVLMYCIIHHLFISLFNLTIVLFAVIALSFHASHLGLCDTSRLKGYLSSHDQVALDIPPRC